MQDIKMILTNQLPFQECLKNQDAYIENYSKELGEVQKSVKKYKNKHLPIIPALQEIEDDYPISTWTFGYPKTTPTVTLSLKLTKKSLIRKLIFFFIRALAVGLPYV